MQLGRFWRLRSPSRHGDPLEARRWAGCAAKYVPQNGLGAFATGITTLVVLVAKFVDGAWITVRLILSLIFIMRSVKQHYSQVGQEINITTPINTENPSEPIVLLPA